MFMLSEPISGVSTNNCSIVEWGGGGRVRLGPIWKGRR
jgi:hypothetical protein